MKTERKILVSIGLISLLLIGATIYSSINVTSIRTISGSTDDSYTKIRCGNGNMYAVSAANLATALALGTEVILPPCNITITSTLTPASNTILRGAGSSQTILFLPALGNKDIMSIVSKQDIKISGICFNLNNRSQTAHSSYSMIDITGVAGSFSKNITIDSCSFLWGTTGSCVNCEDETEYITISNCDFRQREYFTPGWGSGIRFSSNYCTAKNNHFLNMYSGAIYLEYPHVTAPQKTSAYNLIDGNFITGVGAIGIAIEGWGTTGTYAKAGMTVITNNVIWNLTGDYTGGYGTAFPRGIQAMNNCTVSNNVISGGGTIYGGIICNAGAGDYNIGVTITSNIVRDVTKYAINLENMRHCSVGDNILIGDTGSADGIQLYNAMWCTLTGNSIVGFAKGISEETTSNYNIFIGNECDNNTVDIDLLPGANDVYLNMNIGTVV